MTFAVGIFDLFTYTIPGALYLGLFGFLAARMHWVDPAATGHLPTFLLVVVLILASYLLGYMAYPVGAFLERVVPRRRVRQPQQEFLNRVPAARDRDFVRADRALLLAAIELHDKNAAVEISRPRASGLMLRNSAPVLALGIVVAFVEIFTGGKPAAAAVATATLAAGAVALVIQGRRLSYWAAMKTLELAFWLPDVDEKTRAP